MKLKDNALNLIVKQINDLTENLDFRKERQKSIPDVGVEIAISNIEAEINSLKNLLEE